VALAELGTLLSVVVACGQGSNTSKSGESPETESGDVEEKSRTQGRDERTFF